MHYIYGTDRLQSGIFTSLEDQIHETNYIRLINLIAELFVDKNIDIFQEKGQTNTGRKAYPPSVLLKIYMYGYLNGIASSRKLEKECYRNIEMIWLTQKLAPDHKTLSDFRTNNAKAIRAVMVKFNELLKESGYIKGKTVSVDGSKVRANANLSVDLAWVENKIEDIENQIQQYLERISQNDQEEIELEQIKAEKQAILEEIENLKNERDKLKGQKSKMQENSLKRLNTTDADARIMKGKGGGKHFSYNFQVAIDSEYHLIATQYVTNKENDFYELVPVVDQLEKELNIIPENILADTGYYIGREIELLEQERAIQCFVPIHFNQQQNRMNKAQISFNYDAEEDEYICSQGKKLVPKGKIKKDNRRNTEAQKYVGLECQECLIKPNCTNALESKIIYRYKNQNWKDAYQKKMVSEKAKTMMKQRRSLSEHPFGTIKYLMGQIPILLRGLNKVKIEMDLYTIAYNFKRLIAIEQYVNLEKLVIAYNWKSQ
jgi:transposase